MLKINNLSTYYFTGEKAVKAVDDVSLEIGENEFFGLVGPSGCGKSTLGFSIMKLIEGPGRILRGSVALDGTDILSLNGPALEKVRGARISMIFQDPMTCLNPVITVGEQISEAVRCHLGSGRKEAREKVIDLFRSVKIDGPDKRYDNYPHELSGGMRQRVMIAMAVSCGARFMIADEPTTALDVTTQRGIMELLLEIKERSGLSILLITHNTSLVKKYCTAAAVMKSGKIVFQGGSGGLTGRF